MYIANIAQEKPKTNILDSLKNDTGGHDHEVFENIVGAEEKVSSTATTERKDISQLVWIFCFVFGLSCLHPLSFCFFLKCCRRKEFRKSRAHMHNIIWVHRLKRL